MQLPAIHRVAGRIRLAVLAVAAASVVLGSTQAATSAPVYQVPATITSNCSADVTQPLLNWIASVPDNSVLSFAGGACYRIDGTLELNYRHGLTFDGNGATFKATTVQAGRSQWRLVEGSDFTFRDMTIDGGDAQGGTFNAALQHSHGIELLGPSGVDIGNVSISNVYGDCVYVGQGYYSKSWSSDVHVHDSSCSRAGRMGVALTAARNVLIERTSFDQVGMTVFDIEPNGAGFGVNGATFTNNHVRSIETFDALGDGPVDSVTVSDNDFAGVGTHMAVIALPGQRHSNIAIIGNTAEVPYSNPGTVAIDIVRVDGLTVTGNTIPLGAENMALVDVSESCSINVSGNSFAGGVAEARIHPFGGCTYTTPLVSTAPLGTGKLPPAGSTSPLQGGGTSPVAGNGSTTPPKGGVSPTHSAPSAALLRARLSAPVE